MAVKQDLIDPLTRQSIMISWYSTLEVLFKMVDYTKNRECAFLISKADTSGEYFKNTRYLCIHCVRDFNYLLQMGLKVLTEPRLYNLYYSVAEFKDKFPFWQLGADRKVKIKNWIERKMCSEIKGYDLFFDVDADKITFQGAKITVERLKEVLDEFNIHYEIRSSGKGFHVIAPNYQFQDQGFVYNEDDKDSNNLCNLFFNVAMNLNEQVSSLIDTSVYDLRRVTKIPYSLVHYVDEIRVCFPFESESEFERYKYEDGTYENFKQFMGTDPLGWQYLLRNRQTFIFNKDKIPNVKGFISKYGGN